ncbi:MAG: hypothetical protein ACHQF3_06095 [Alphaproteobacteria bacterium]
MRVARLGWAFLLVVGLVGCGFFQSDASPDELARISVREKLHIYFKGQTAAVPNYSERIGPVQGKACQAALFGSVTEFQALQILWVDVQTKKGTGVVDVVCESASFFVPSAGSYCWPGYACKGIAVK